MIEFEAFDLSAGKETTLANVEVEMLERSISESDDGIFFTNRAFGVVSGCLGCCQAVQDWNPNDRLRFELQPFEEVGQADFARTLSLSKMFTKSHQSCL
jgi:hypothetical protein